MYAIPSLGILVSKATLLNFTAIVITIAGVLACVGLTLLINSNK